MKPLLDRLFDTFCRCLPVRSGLQLDPELLAEAGSLAREHGMRTEEFVARLLHQEVARQELREQRQCCWETLSGRERQVAALLRQGLSSAEIAAHLVLTPTTVKSHLYHVAKKFGVRTRAELISALEDISLD